MATMTSAEAQNHFGELLEAAQREAVVITRHGRPAVFVVSAVEMSDLLESGAGAGKQPASLPLGGARQRRPRGAAPRSPMSRSIRWCGRSDEYKPARRLRHKHADQRRAVSCFCGGSRLFPGTAARSGLCLRAVAGKDAHCLERKQIRSLHGEASPDGLRRSIAQHRLDVPGFPGRLVRSPPFNPRPQKPHHSRAGCCGGGRCHRQQRSRATYSQSLAQNSYRPGG